MVTEIAVSDKQDFYDDVYHQSRSQHLIADDAYYLARGVASVALYFSEAEQERRIFEYGCGVGQTIANLPKAGGWDVSCEARAVCRAKGLNVPDRIDEVESDAWDIVFCRHVLEHVEDPLATLRLLRRLATPEGELYLILPRERHGGSELTPDHNQHLFSWNFRTINNLLHRSGWFPYHNEVKYSWGYRRLLPVRRLLGPGAYLQAACLVGRLWNNGELVIRCR
jgi:SAM-dependent methyltransferase